MPLFDKVYGCLLAGAVGNAFGSPVEGMNYTEIVDKYGKIETILDASRLEAEDDNALGLILCKAYLKKQAPVTSFDLADMWLQEMDPLKFFWCMRNTYELIRQGVSPRLTGIHNIVTGSAIMAIAPVGIYNAGDPERAYVDALDIGYMYQPSQDVDAACVIAACVAEAFKTTATVDSIINTALKYATKKPYIAFDDRKHNNLYDSISEAIDIASKYNDVYSLREEIYQNCIFWHMIDPTEVLVLTLAIFKASNGDTRQAIIGGTNIGRDTDTISNLNGALCGTLNGIGSLPREWVEMFNKKSVETFNEISKGMTDLILKKTSEAEARIKMIKSL